MALVDVAAASGADAVKLQTFTPEQMVALDVMIKRGPWAGLYALELYQRTHTPRAWHPELFARARELGMEAFSSVFHPDDVDFLETLGCPRYKIASFELTDLDLIHYAANKGRPLMMSTGMATWPEISEAILAANEAKDLTLLKCTSAYPAEAKDANLAAGRAIVDAYIARPLKWGLSDHTLGITVPGAATSLGADVIEKHLTLSRADGGPDATFSSEPQEFAAMVAHCRQVALTLGEVKYGPTEAEKAYLPLRRPPGGMRGQ